MTLPENDILRPLAMSVLTCRVGVGGDAGAVRAKASLAYNDLVGVLVPLIGQIGVEALSARALNRARGDYPAGSAPDTEETGDAAARISAWLALQDPARVADAAATMLSTLGGLLVSLIGEPLTMCLLRKAWPDGFSDTHSQEIPT